MENSKASDGNASGSGSGSTEPTASGQAKSSVPSGHTKGKFVNPGQASSRIEKKSPSPFKNPGKKRK